ncbi:MAG: hypothetical protein M1285_02885 [Candidatus Thermoplasmatota archaeon]|nr:hypothetical protein [Candidatus Thermoplasmatota archaeon]
MADKDNAVGLRIDRNVYNMAMKMKETARMNGNPAAYSTQSWFSMLIMKGMDELKTENKGEKDE